MARTRSDKLVFGAMENLIFINIMTFLGKYNSRIERTFECTYIRRFLVVDEEYIEVSDIVKLWFSP